MTQSREIRLKARPKGMPTADTFELATVDLAAPGPGEVQVRNQWMTVDPYMRGRMNDSKSYTAPQPLNEVMLGGTVGEIVESRNPDWKQGDKVGASFGWQQYGTSNGKGLQRLDTSKIAISAYLGTVGMPGVTAWYGLNKILTPKPGQTIAVSAASGAVGTVVGQLAKRAGCHVVGIAGGPEKCRYVVDHLGFDHCVDYKTSTLEPHLAAAAPNGIDAYFDNVGGPVLDAVLARMNAHGRIAVCGAISGYDGGTPPLVNPRLILISRLLIQGFIVSEHLEIWPEALKELQSLAEQGHLKFRESIAQGLEAAPEAFIGLLKGHNFGKQLVKLI